MVCSVMRPSLLKVGFHILLPFLLFSIHVDHAMSTNDYIDSRCSTTANYTAGSVFKRNMRSVFSTLTKDAPPVRFSNATTGQGSDRVHGLVQCRGDVDEDTCNGCISNSTQQIVGYCPNATDAIVWYEKCQLRYSNTNFFGHLNVEDYGSWYWINDKVEHPEAFNKKLGSLLKNLTYQATTEPSRFMFATGNIPYDDLQTIYGLVQCTRDTSFADCSLCLNSTISKIPPTCENGHGCEIATGSCRVRYDTELFYGTPTTPTSSPPKPPSNSSPSPSPNSAPPSNSSPSPSPNSAPSSNSSPRPSPNLVPPSSSSPSSNSLPPSPSPSPPPPPADSSPLSSGASNTTSDKPNHSTATSVAMITVITFALTSMMMPSWL